MFHEMQRAKAFGKIRCHATFLRYNADGLGSFCTEPEDKDEEFVNSESLSLAVECFVRQKNQLLATCVLISKFNQSRST